MVQPYNYTLQVADPSQSFTEGIKLGEYFRQRQQAQAQQEKFQQVQSAYYATPQPTLQQTLQYASLLPKDQAELILKGRDAQNTEVTKSNINIGGQVLSSLMQGNKDQAISILRTRAEASKNINDTQGQKQWEMMASTIEKSPSAEQAFKDYSPYMAALGEEGRKMLTSVYEAQKQPFEQRKALAAAGEAEAKLNEANIKLKRLDALQEAELRKATSAADEQEIKAKYAERIQKAELTLKNAQSSKATFELTQLKEKADKGPVPEFNAQMGGFVIAPTKVNPQGGFIPLNAAADNKQQQSAIKALNTAGYDPVTGQDDISKLIQKSTSGTMETLGSEVLRFFGATTEGRKAINELATAANAITLDLMGGKLGAGVSNADREFIVSQLGDISNSNKPLGERLAGWTAAKNRMITSGMLPPPTGVTASKPSAPTPSSKFDKMSDAELLQMLNK